LKTYFVVILLFIPFFHVGAQSQHEKLHIYLIPGQGSDERLFNNLELAEQFHIHKLKYTLPEEEVSLSSYAYTISQQIDTTHAFALIGVSLGGMLITEMMDFMHPEKAIIISSAKCRKELPFHYRVQRIIPLHKMVPGWLSKIGAQVLQPIVEPDRKREKSTFTSMLKAKDPKFYKRSIAMIMPWDRTNYSEEIIHIHGTKDNTIPIKNVSYDYGITAGSHMMTLTEGMKISKLLNQILEGY
jgi:hypothetical protein